MRPDSQGGRRTALAALLLFGSMPLASALAAPPQQDTNTPEEIEPIDPYTRGDEAAMAKAGYVSFGPFHWAADHSTSKIVETLGGIPMVFIETEHFRLASTLGTYRASEDPAEIKLIEAELAALKKKLPKVKVGKKLDPWLRAHLYAHRLESLHAEFCKRFGLTDEEFAAAMPVPEAPPGTPPRPYKFTVMLTQTRSALGRYLRAHLNAEDDYSYRAQFHDSHFFGANFESLKESGIDLDVALYAVTAGVTAQHFVDAFEKSSQASPEWFRHGVAHWFGRRVDGRWSAFKVSVTTTDVNDGQAIWEPRVHGLVKNDAYPSWADMMKWQSHEDIKPRDHMIAWSRVDWLMSHKGDQARDMLFALAQPVAELGLVRAKAREERELAALQRIWKKDPAGVDALWRAWVLKTYPAK